jgi:hypothetical protein
MEYLLDKPVRQFYWLRLSWHLFGNDLELNTVSFGIVIFDQYRLEHGLIGP